MPKKLNISANQRVDLPDYVRGASDYTEESGAFMRRKMLQAKRSAVLEGFRIEIPDQTTNPGQIIVYNGVAVDRDGLLLNNEDQVNDSRTITLSGGSTTFYVEIEFTESESDVDARAFWDPTTANPGDLPPGQEFTINVATRLSPDWQVVTPISTTGFELDTDDNSTKIPLAVLTTNVSNEILAGSNPGLVQVVASSKLEEDSAISATTLRLVDSRLFPDTGVCTVDFGDTSVETSINIIANDRTNNTITVSPALSNAHLAGAIVRITGVTATFVQERTSALPATGHPDWRRKLWNGDEIRGSGLIKSKETYGARDDVDLRTVKDTIDVLTSQIREMKVGSTRSDDVQSLLPPVDSTSWNGARWYDHAGSLQGSRSFSITIGDGVDSLGDLNLSAGASPTTDLTVLINQAIGALDATYGGSVLVKRGTYSIKTSISIDRPLYLEFEEGCVLSGEVVTLVSIGSPVRCELRNFRIASYIGTGDNLITISSTSGADLRLYDCDFGSLDLTAITSANSTNLHLERCTLTARNGNDCLMFSTTVSALDNSGIFSILRNCSLYTAVASAGCVSGAYSFIMFDNCTFESTLGFLLDSSATGYNNEYITFNKCKFIDGSGADSCLTFASSLTDHLVFDSCNFDGVVLDVTNTGTNNAIIFIGATANSNILINDCSFNSTISGTTGDADRGRFIYCNTVTNNLVVSNNTFGDLTTPDLSSYRVALELNDSITNDFTVFVDNVSRSMYQHVRGNASHIYVLNNDLQNNASSSTASRNDTVVWVGGGTSTGIVFVSGNYIVVHYLDASTKTFVGIELDSRLGKFYIVDNHIAYMGHDNATNASNCYGIHKASTGSLTASICNNSIENVVSGSSTANVVGIYCNSTDESALVLTISNNYINITTHGGDIRGCIYLDSQSGSSHVNVVTNNLYIYSGTNGTEKFYGVYFLCDRINCAGNNIGIDTGSVLSGSSASAGIHSWGGYCSILNNTITGGTNAASLLIHRAYNSIVGGNVLLGSTSSVLPVCVIGNGVFNIFNTCFSDNIIHINSTSGNCDGLYVSSNATIQHGITVADNIFHENTFAAARQAIVMTGIDEISVQNNVVYGTTLNATARSGGACIDISYFEQGTVSHNVVRGWARSSIYTKDATILSVDNAYMASILGNVLERGTAVLATVAITNSDRITFVGNVYGPGGTLDTTTGTPTTNLVNANNMAT